MAIKTFKDVWKFPLWYDEMDRVFDNEDTLAFDFNGCDVPEPLKKIIVACLNDEFEVPVYMLGSLVCKEEAEIYHTDLSGKEKRIINLRGWGHLTGTLRLTSKKAAEFQDQFAAFIISKLTDAIS